MEEFLKWIIENKELAILLLITISIPVSISMHFGRTIINNKKITNNRHTTNNYTNKQMNNTQSPNQLKQNMSNDKTNSPIELKKIMLYSTGKKGKVYTQKFYKQINYNFGIEIIIKNNTNAQQNVKVGWCIYKDGTEIIKGSFNKTINANTTVSNDFYIKQESFSKLKPGKYKSQFWVNDERVQKIYFYILNK